MILGAAAAALLVIYASALNLLLYPLVRATTRSPALAAAEARARRSLIGLALPVALALLATGRSLNLQLHHPLFSPHAERLRPHACLRLLLAGPDAPWQARLFAGLALALVLAALAVAGVGLVRGWREQRRLHRQAQLRDTATAPSWLASARVWEDSTSGLASARGWRGEVIVHPAIERLFPGAQAAAVLAHEVHHAQRRDPVLGPLVNALALLSALSPGAWLERARWRRDREAACDAYAAQVVSPEAMQESLVTAGELAEVLAEISPLAELDRDLLAHVQERRTALEAVLEGRAAAPAQASWRGELVLGAALAVALLALGWWEPVRDSLQCAAESFLHALGQ
ncbi:MAG TPA: M56 family metallopeptidase [Armatimonadota bacterium]|jgi:Zn-dependent protease with chaperone function